MQPGNPGPGQDPYQQYPPGYGQIPQYQDPYATGSPAVPPPAHQPPVQPTEYSLYPPATEPPPAAYPQSPAAYPQSPAYPQPPQYPPTGYSVPPMGPGPMAGTGQSNTLGLLSMIFGIVSIPLLFCCYLGVPLGIAAIVLGILGMGKANRGEASNKGMSIAGLATGAATIAILVVLIILYVAIGFSSLPSTKY
jgi:hypothetical protein